MSALVMIVSAVLLQVQKIDVDAQMDADVEMIQFDRWQKYYRTVAGEYDIEIGKDSTSKPKLQPEPVFSYSNPAAGNKSHGAMFL